MVISSDAPQRVDDLQTHGGERRPRAGDETKRQHQRDARPVNVAAPMWNDGK